eukprot:9489158-Pyramimonas_sp.AAC.4
MHVPSTCPSNGSPLSTSGFSEVALIPGESPHALSETADSTQNASSVPLKESASSMTSSLLETESPRRTRRPHRISLEPLQPRRRGSQEGASVSPREDESQALYHERQVGALCAVHALNCLLQRQAFTPERLDRLVRSQVQHPSLSPPAKPSRAAHATHAGYRSG